MIQIILELDEVEKYLKTRNILKQYVKAKRLIIFWNPRAVKFKKRKPKTLNVYQFRITDKYRAFWFFDKSENGVFKVMEISDHQD